MTGKLTFTSFWRKAQVGQSLSKMNKSTELLWHTENAKQLYQSGSTFLVLPTDYTEVEAIMESLLW